MYMTCIFRGIVFLIHTSIGCYPTGSPFISPESHKGRDTQMRFMKRLPGIALSPGHESIGTALVGTLLWPTVPHIFRQRRTTPPVLSRDRWWEFSTLVKMN